MLLRSLHEGVIPLWKLITSHKRIILCLGHADVSSHGIDLYPQLDAIRFH